MENDLSMFKGGFKYLDSVCHCQVEKDRAVSLTSTVKKNLTMLFCHISAKFAFL